MRFIWHYRLERPRVGLHAFAAATSMLSYHNAYLTRIAGQGIPNVLLSLGASP